MMAGYEAHHRSCYSNSMGIFPPPSYQCYLKSQATKAVPIFIIYNGKLSRRLYGSGCFMSRAVRKQILYCAWGNRCARITLARQSLMPTPGTV